MSTLYEAGEVEKEHRQHCQDLEAGRVRALEVIMTVFRWKSQRMLKSSSIKGSQGKSSLSNQKRC